MEEDDGGQRDMDDERLQRKIIQLGKIDLGKSQVLQVTEHGMMNDHDDQNGDLQLPVLIGDKDRTADKRKKNAFQVWPCIWLIYSAIKIPNKALRIYW